MTFQKSFPRTFFKHSPGLLSATSWVKISSLPNIMPLVCYSSFEEWFNSFFHTMIDKWVQNNTGHQLLSLHWYIFQYLVLYPKEENRTVLEQYLSIWVTFRYFWWNPRAFWPCIDYHVQGPKKVVRTSLKHYTWHQWFNHNFNTHSQEYHDACVCIPLLGNKVQRIWVLRQNAGSCVSSTTHMCCGTVVNTC